MNIYLHTEKVEMFKRQILVLHWLVLYEIFYDPAHLVRVPQMKKIKYLLFLELIIFKKVIMEPQHFKLGTFGIINWQFIPAHNIETTTGS